MGRLFDYVDKKIGLRNVIVIMTADHGVAPVPELLAEQKMPAGRIATGFFDPISPPAGRSPVGHLPRSEQGAREGKRPS
jgi:arylsulfatase A-like enzyme